jgi:hypothetical protein
MYALYDMFCICYDFCVTLRLFYAYRVMCILVDCCTLTFICVDCVICAFLKHLNYKHSCYTCVYRDRSVNIIRVHSIRCVLGVVWSWHGRCRRCTQNCSREPQTAMPSPWIEIYCFNVSLGRGCQVEHDWTELAEGRVHWCDSWLGNFLTCGMPVLFLCWTLFDWRI